MELPRSAWQQKLVESLHAELTELEDEWNDGSNLHVLGDILDRHFPEFTIRSLELQPPLDVNIADWMFRLRVWHNGRKFTTVGTDRKRGTAMCRAIWFGWGTVLEKPPQDRFE